MRAAMTSLANIHGITFSFMKSLGGKEGLLTEFPTIKEQVREQLSAPFYPSSVFSTCQGARRS